jgi:uroporphyrinogen III methyltransferase/synthase
MSPNKPAAVIERGTFPTQRVFTAPLSELVIKAAEEKIKPPALYVIGEVVDLHKYLMWFKDKPLFGRRIMILRPTDQAVDMYQNLRELGAEILPYPTIATKHEKDSSAWQRLDRLIQNRNDHCWLVFTSENCVRYFIEQFNAKYGDMRKLGNFKIAAIGFGTTRALKKYALTADFMPSIFTAENLAREMSEKMQLDGAKIVRIRGNLADQRIEERLAGAGADVIPLQVYQTFYPQWPDGFKAKLFENPPNIIIFSSGSTVDGFFKLLNKTEIEELTSNADLVSIGPMTTRAIESRGLKIKIEAAEHSIPGIIEELKKNYGDN